MTKAISRSKRSVAGTIVHHGDMVATEAAAIAVGIAAAVVMAEVAAGDADTVVEADEVAAEAMAAVAATEAEAIAVADAVMTVDKKMPDCTAVRHRRIAVDPFVRWALLSARSRHVDASRSSFREQRGVRRDAWPVVAQPSTRTDRDGHAALRDAGC
jgi:hypothetical protein